MSKSGSSSSGGIGVCGLLGVAFVVLKLTGVINWSWWWVTCPFWIGLPIILAIIIVALPIIMIVQARKRSRSNTKGVGRRDSGSDVPHHPLVGPDFDPQK